MAIEFDGHVLRSPRSAPGNTVTASEPRNGVVRAIQVTQGRSAAEPAIVDMAADQYRASILDAPGTTPNEYLVWAANSSQVALVSNSDWWQSDGSGRIPVGTGRVIDLSDPTIIHEDGATKVIVTDNGGRDLVSITHIVVARGDKTYSDDGWVDVEDPTQGREGSAPYEVIVPGDADVDLVSGVVTLTDTNGFRGDNLAASVDIDTLFAGGLSVGRGDAVVGVRYTVAPSTFWWTRNDRYETRFGWDAKLQRWRAYKGTHVKNLGALLFEETYSLTPKVRSLPVGAVLSGDASVGDGFATLRVGTSPGASSLPVGVNDPDGFTGVEIVADADVAEEYDFAGSSAAAVVGQASGILQFNPRYVEKHAGKTIWYNYRSFTAESDGVVGDLFGADRNPLYLAPIPSPTDQPFIRLGFRTPLSVTLVETEADLPATVDSGACYVARSTGRLLLSQADVNKADPTNLESFDKHFLGCKVLYDGVALNQVPQPTKEPVPLIQGDGTELVHPSDPMYIRPASVWSEDQSGSAYRGLWKSGILFVPDGTGAVPNPEGVDPSTVDVPVRPGGDTLSPVPQSIGLVRAVRDGVGDTILFSREGAVRRIEVVDRIEDLPEFPFAMKGGRAYISREGVSIGGVFCSQVQLSSRDRDRFAGRKVYFLQASMQPAYHTTVARIFSKSRIIFRFDGDEVLYFSVDGTAHDWHASSLPVQEFYTAEEVAESIQDRITAQGGTGICTAVSERVVLESPNLTSGTVEIGWGDPKDLSGCAALGFMPGWRAVGNETNWLVDSGISVGMGRSLLNLNRSRPTPDYRHRSRLEEEVLTTSVSASPFVFVDYPPLQDVAGFDEGVFFNLQNVTLQGEDIQIVNTPLEHYDDIQHRFDEGKFAWIDQTVTANAVQTRTATFSLGQLGVVPETLLGAPGIGGGLFTAEEAGRYLVQEQNVDYLLPEDGTPGVVQLVTRYGSRVSFGSRGLFSAGSSTFTDAEAGFLADSADPDLDDEGNQKVNESTGALVWLPQVRPGFRLKMASGDAIGSYIVTEVVDGQTVRVSPPFQADASRPAPWEMFTGITTDLYDPAVVADHSYKVFNHLSEEPFKVRTLTPLGAISGIDFTANVEEANASGREVGLRFGPNHPAATTTATLTALTSSNLGTIQNGTLAVPDETFVDEQAFRIQIGTELFEHGSGLEAVVAFSDDPDAVEYLTADWDSGDGIYLKGALKFSSTLLSDLEKSEVIYQQEALPGASLSAGEAQYDPKTGSVRISSADAATHAGKTLYFVEQMTTFGEEVESDVAVSPTVGAVSFRKPVSKNVLVEMQYWEADVEGRRVGGPEDYYIEFLSVFVRREEATRLSDSTFQIDPGGVHVINDDIDPLVYVGPVQQNFGVDDFTIDNPPDINGRRISFDRDLPSWATPVVTYSVFNAQGGERAYNTSRRPVYRPPFFIKEGQDKFGLRGNRVDEFEPGQMLRIGEECFYITALRYFEGSDVTRVDIYPSTVTEVGSRSPGNDVLTLITAEPITTVLDPDGESPVATTARAGFMQEIPLSDFPFEPVNANQGFMVFQGNLTRFAVAGHIMEVAGQPFTISNAALNEDGTRTRISFTSPFRLGVDPAADPTVKLSYRPVYPPSSRNFIGLGALVQTEPLELTLFGEKDADGNELPGRELARGTEWQVDPATGEIELLDPLQNPLGSEQTLLLSHTQLRVMEPFYSGGEVVFPRWVASFRHVVNPSEDNGLLGGTLTATYTFDHPDAFYFRVPLLRDYLGEAIQAAVAELKQGQSGGGPRLTVIQGQDNWDQGSLGLTAQRRDLVDKDRAARAMLSFYNGAIEAFEQVEEAITGTFIGDRDGKFRFWVGRGKEYPPPGFEDPITGVLNTRNVFALVFNAADPTRDINFLPGTDPLVKPRLATMADLRLEGEPMPVEQLERLMRRQRRLIRNDVDDQLLVGLARPSLVLTNSAPFFTLRQNARYRKMGLSHQFSRLFPTSARVFFTLAPGIGAELEARGTAGVYAWRRINEETEEAESTYRQQIGQIGNPVLGDISNLTEKFLRLRLPRSRVFGYYPDGLPADTLFSGQAAIIEPCMILSQVALSVLPIDPATGYPDISRLLSESPSGDTPDAVSGDPELSIPGFEVGQKLAFGKPDGKLYAAVYPEEVDVFGNSTYTGIHVAAVQHGCVVTFADRKGSLITDPSKIMVASAPTNGRPADEFGIGRADTLYVIPSDIENPIEDPESESPTMEQLQKAAETLSTFRTGFDIGVKSDGRVLDISLPSWDDPFLFPLKEMLGQKPPDPLSHLEGEVDFSNTDSSPLEIPALLGDPQDDSGDYQIPYMKGTNTELDRFDEIQNVIGPLMDADPIAGGYYPDEVTFADGEVLAAAVPLGGGFYKEPCTLMTQTANPSAGLGTAPAQEGDLLLVEVDTGGLAGWMGILSVGAVRSAVVGSDNWMWVEPPRFVTQVNQGSPIRYALANYAVHTTPGNYPTNPQVTNPVGLRLFDDIANGNTIISIQDIVLALNDADTSGVGNLNTIIAADAANEVQINIIGRPDDTVVNGPAGAVSIADAKDGRPLLTLRIRSGDIRYIDYQGNDSGWVAHGGVTFGTFDPNNTGAEVVPGTVGDERHIFISGLTGFLPFTPAVGTEAEWFLPHDHLDPAGPTDRKVCKYGWEFTVTVDTTAGQSTSAYIESDRLTFHEVIDFRLGKPHDFEHDNGVGSPYAYATGLQVTEVTLGSGGFSTVNDVAGTSLTFRSRTGATDDIEGTWNPAASPAEEGSIKVMGFEYGIGSTPITASNITASITASQRQHHGGGIILNTNGTAEANRIHSLTAPAGLANVEKGDLVYIDRSDDTLPNAPTEKAGTYVVRYAVEDDGSGYKEVTRSSLIGTGGGFITTRFPRVVAIDVSGGTMEVDDTSMLPATGKLFIPLNASGLDSTDAAVYKEAVASVDFTVASGTTLTLGAAATWRWADDSTIVSPATSITEAKVVGKQITWHDNPVGISPFSAPGTMAVEVVVKGGQLPNDSSVVGHNVAGTAVYGFNDVRFTRNGNSTNLTTANIVAGAPALGEVGVDPAAVHANETFDPTGAAAVYDDVPRTLYVYLRTTQAIAINDPNALSGSGRGVAALFPGTEVATDDGAGGAAFFAEAGVFLEPSIPTMPVDLDPASVPKVVDAARSMVAGTVGMRSPGTSEDVHFEVRRIRRWHGAQNLVNDAFKPLRYAYEIRRGIITGFSRNAQQVGTLVASGFTMDWNTANPAKPLVPDVWNTEETGLDGTNLGGFDNEDVNINTGDIVRVLDDDGAVLAEGFVQTVVDSTTLKIRPPGMPETTALDLVGRRFEVWLRQAPVPHEQSNEQLLALVTDSVVHEQSADRSDPDPDNWTGGYVPETDGTAAWLDVTNKLYDDSAGFTSFSELGVRKDDIVIIDPAGTLPVVDERGTRPIGDTSVPTRTAVSGGSSAPSPYTSGPVNPLDDNRGFYRVVEVNSDHLELDPVHLFGGTLGQDRVFGSTRTNLVYAVLPTVGSSVMSTDGAEGQNDLRPTRKASGGTYRSGDAVEDAHSLRPFSYKIIRPSTLFSTEAVDTVLFMRERMLSLIELFRSAMDGTRGGLYYDWQADEHVLDLGSPTDPESGIGFFPNRVVTTLVGEVGISPFANTSDCLSLLDRRFWILDRRLDSREPNPTNSFAMREATGTVPFDEVGGPYTAYTDTNAATGGSEVRPVLLDHLDLILDVRDRLRNIRYTWLTYRTHRYVGTLARIRAFDRSLPERRAERRRTLILESTADKVQT